MRRSSPRCVSLRLPQQGSARKYQAALMPTEFRDRSRTFAGYVTPEPELAHEPASRRRDSRTQPQLPTPISEEEMK